MAAVFRYTGGNDPKGAKGVRRLAVAAALGLALLLSGCGGQEPEERTIFAMDTVMTLRAWGDDSAAALEEAIGEINALDQLLSVNNEESDIWAVNHTAGPVTVGGDTASLIQTGLTLWRATGGALNIALYPVVRAWGFTTGDYRVVDEAERQELLARTDLDKLDFDAGSGTVELPEGMELDLGSLGKGYAGDRVMEIFRAHGVEHATISLGGNVQTLGTRPDGTPWRIAIQDPEDADGMVGVIEVTDQAVVTSGGYERYFEAEGQTYWHIMDPATGAPADSGLISATVVGAQGVLCDGLSTALFVLGAEGAADYWRANGGFDYLLIGADHTIYLTQGLAERFTPAEGYEDWPLQVVTE
jgi:thiamine biosynthesis lipoprotein